MAEPPQPARRGPGRPFQPGQSGNPGGSVKGLERRLRDELKAVRQTVEVKGTDGKSAPVEVDGYAALFRRMWDIAMTGENRDSLVAIKLIYERTHGMPKQKIEFSEDDQAEDIDWDSLSTEELRVLAKVRFAMPIADDVH